MKSSTNNQDQAVSDTPTSNESQPAQLSEQEQALAVAKSARYQAGASNNFGRYLWPVCALILLLAVNLVLDPSFF